MSTILICENPLCGKSFERRIYKISKHNYCSHSCAVAVNNKTHPRNPGKIEICAYCGKDFKSREKYCSRKCKDLGESISAKSLIGQIKNFVKKNGRIPFKQEFVHSHAARLRFGTWNKAIEAAGLKPNPVMFAKKYVAKDGDRCDSLAEKIIDDYLSKRNIKHIRNFPYPGDDGFTVDFKVGDNWIEFFGLAGQLERYDQLKKRKLRLSKKLGINLIRIYPKDLFPINKLDKKLTFLKILT
jgi:hypothetical protein